MTEPLISFRPAELVDDLAARHDKDARSIGARSDLLRYYRVLERELKQIDINDDEACLLCDAIDGSTFTPENFQFLWAHVDEAIRHKRLDQKYEGLDAPALVAKLRDLTPGAGLALIDAAERYWRAPVEGPRRSVLELAGHLPAQS